MIWSQIQNRFRVFRFVLKLSPTGKRFVHETVDHPCSKDRALSAEGQDGFEIPSRTTRKMMTPVAQRWTLLHGCLVTIVGIQCSIGVLGDDGFGRLPGTEVEASSDELEVLREQKHQKYDEIRRRLDHLSAEWQKHRPETVNAAEPEAIEGPDELSVPLPLPVENGDQIDQRAPQPQPVADDELMPEVPTEKFPSRSPEPVNGPIDRQALASSLFANGNYEACLQTLQDVQTPSGIAAHWVMYLEAGCLRKLGESEEAQRRYRRIVAASDSEWLGDLSAWWLDQLHEKQQLQAKRDDFTKSLEQWEKVVDELTRAAQ